MSPIYDEDDILITEAVQSALSTPDMILIKNRTLDGKYHVQSIGSGTSTVEVVAHFTKAEKLVFDEIYRTSGTITVVFDGRWYEGFIDEGPSAERLPNQDEAMFTISFTLVLIDEGEVS